MHHAVPPFVATGDKHAQVRGRETLDIVVEGGVGSASQEVEVGTSHAAVGLDASVGEGRVNVVIDAFLAGEQRDAEVDQMVDLVQQHRFFLLPETFQHTGAGDVEFDVAHHFSSFKATVNQGNLARCQRLWHAVRDSLFGQHQSGDKRRVRHAPTRLGEDLHTCWVGKDALWAFFSHRFCCLNGKASEVLLHGSVNLS